MVSPLVKLEVYAVLSEGRDGPMTKWCLGQRGSFAGAWNLAEEFIEEGRKVGEVPIGNIVLVDIINYERPHLYMRPLLPSGLGPTIMDVDEITMPAFSQISHGADPFWPQPQEA